MRRETSRTRKISALLQRELATLIQQEIKDPRAAKVTLTAVDVAPDLSHAKVYVTHLSGAEHARDLVKVLNRAAGFLRHELGERIELRSLPQLRFVYDESVERGMALSALIDRARSQDKH